MSGGGWKEPFYKIAAQDSRNMADLGNKLGWDYLEEEGNRNTENPGRAITKAAEYALAGYLGGLYGGLYEGAAGTAATAAADAMPNAVPVTDYSTTASAADSARVANMTSGSSLGTKKLAMQMGMQSMQPQQPQQPVGAPPPRGQASNEPLPLPYGQQGTNGLLSLEEIERKRKMGLLR